MSRRDHADVLAYGYPMLAFWTMMWFLWFLWIFLLFRDDSLSGWGKAGWTVFVIVLPYLGVFVYLLARGKGMSRREAEDTLWHRNAFGSYVRETAASSRPSSADELAELSDLRTRGLGWHVRPSMISGCHRVRQRTGGCLPVSWSIW